MPAPGAPAAEVARGYAPLQRRGGHRRKGAALAEDEGSAGGERSRAATGPGLTADGFRSLRRRSRASAWYARDMGRWWRPVGARGLGAHRARPAERTRRPAARVARFDRAPWRRAAGARRAVPFLGASR